jgi:hypothetical protein
VRPEGLGKFKIKCSALGVDPLVLANIFMLEDGCMTKTCRILNK